MYQFFVRNNLGFAFTRLVAFAFSVWSGNPAVGFLFNIIPQMSETAFNDFTRGVRRTTSLGLPRQKFKN
nr:hypothetical protein [Capnocytophaga canimorsus]